MKTRPMVVYHRAGSRMEQNTTLGSRPPRPHDNIGFSPSKMGNFTDLRSTQPERVQLWRFARSGRSPSGTRKLKLDGASASYASVRAAFLTRCYFRFGSAIASVGYGFPSSALQPLSFRLATVRF
jgi:hypothetical protein